MRRQNPIALPALIGIAVLAVFVLAPAYSGKLPLPRKKVGMFGIDDVDTCLERQAAHL